jgi:type I restriction enzyme M protein
MDLIPPGLIVARYFPAEQARVDELSVAADEAAAALQEYLEEHAVEGGLLAEALNDAEKVTKVSATARLKVARHEDTDRDEINALARVIDFFNADARAKADHKEAAEALAVVTFKQYDCLTEDEVKGLVLDDKWAATVKSGIESQAQALTSALVDRITELGRRYDMTAERISFDIMWLTDKVAVHLSAMGVEQR